MNIKQKFLLAALAAISVAGYLLLSNLGHGPGFPLDDSWIHQTYARNLAHSGEWAFTSGVPSAGATSFLWVILLALGYLLGVPPLLWAFSLGAILLWVVALTGWRIASLLLPSGSKWPMFIAVFLLFEWHLVWAAVSGMETLLFAWLSVEVLGRLFKMPGPNHFDVRFWWVSGGFIGLASLTRPEGITLLAPFFFAVIIYLQAWKERAGALAQILASFLVVFIPYLLFNFNLSGGFWPNTFYAKQAEYAVLLEQSFASRFIDQLSLPLVGAGSLLLPAFAFLIYRALKERNWSVLLLSSWAFGFLGLYALRLPVLFQHGRYAIPVMPMYFLLAFIGLAQWLRFNSEAVLPRVTSRVWLLAIVIIQFAFWGLGARAYRQDVAFIESEMVATAKWLAENTPSDSLIAAHDIGAVGYFSERPLLDLAGLISPEVIPFIRDEEDIALYLNRRGADYLMTFPEWYPSLSKNKVVIYQSDSSTDGGNMTVFFWREP